MEYLTFLFNEGLQWRTIGFHHSTLSGTFPLIDGFNIGEHPLVSCLLKGIFNARPPKKNLFPSWEVDVVLQHLKSWEHPSTLNLRDLAKKTVFLLALVSAKRVASLANLSIDPGFMESMSNSIRFTPVAMDKHNRLSYLLRLSEEFQ